MLDASVFPSRYLPFAICIAEANAFPWLTGTTECVRSCGGPVKDKNYPPPSPRVLQESLCPICFSYEWLSAKAR